MENYTRLFDCLSLPSVKQKTVLLSSKVNGAYKDLGAETVINDVNALSNGLIKLGIQPNKDVEACDKIGIISNSRPEWLIADMATQQSGAILVPLYPNTSRSEEHTSELQ